MNLVESQVNPFDHLAEDLSSAGRLGLGHIFAQTPQVAHRGLDYSVHVLGTLGQLGGLEFVLEMPALSFHGREFLAHDVQNFGRSPEKVLGCLIDLAVEVGQLTSNRGDVARAARILTDLLT